VKKAGTYPADDVVMVGEVRLALAAAVDTVGVEIDVVGKTHDVWSVGGRRGRDKVKEILRAESDLTAVAS
jgi:hypothetical protein